MRGLTRPIMIIADTEEEKEFRKQHGIAEPIGDEPGVIDADDGKISRKDGLNDVEILARIFDMDDDKISRKDNDTDE